MATTDRIVAVSNPPGRLRRKGTLRVRIAKTINVCVARDSRNHPVWNST